MTAPVSDAGATTGDGATGQAPETHGGQPDAPTTGSNNAGNIPFPHSDGGPRGRRSDGERVQSASRDDDEPRPAQQGTSTTDSGDTNRGSTEPETRNAGNDWRMEDLPPGARKYIEGLRKESGEKRTAAAAAEQRANEALAKAKAGDDRFANAVEKFMTGLGLTPESDEPERTPEEQLSELTTQYQQSRVELAVFRAAAAQGADPEALLDSRGFLTRAHALDPTADDFSDAIARAIGEAVDKNPKLRAAADWEPPQVPSGGDFGGGPAGPLGPEDWSVDDFRRSRSASNGSGRGRSY